MVNHPNRSRLNPIVDAKFGIEIDGKMFTCYAENIQLAIFKLAKAAGVAEETIETPQIVVLSGPQYLRGGV